MNYRKKGSLVNAVLYTGHNGGYLKEWSGGAVVESPVCEPSPDNPTGFYVQISNSSGSFSRPAGVGDWILRDEGGHYQSLPDQIFRDTYEAVIP